MLVALLDLLCIPQVLILPPKYLPGPPPLHVSASIALCSGPCCPLLLSPAGLPTSCLILLRFQIQAPAGEFYLKCRLEHTRDV
jgi:hypothetical protein